MMARSLTPNTTGRTGRDMERKARRAYKPDGAILRDRAEEQRDEIMACLRARGRPVWLIAAAMQVHDCTVRRRIERWKRMHRADLGS